MAVKSELKELLTGIGVVREEDMTSRQRTARAKRHARLAADVELVFDLIPESDDKWINADTIAGRLTTKTGVQWTRMRVYNAVAELKDRFPDLPLISMPVSGYRFSTDTASVNRMRNWVIRQAIQKIVRLWTGTIVPWLETQDRAKAEDLGVGFKRLVEDLDRVTKR
jgi:hypothetical protein